MDPDERVLATGSAHAKAIQRECLMETPDDAYEDGYDGLGSDELRYLLRAKMSERNPSTALTAEQQIRLSCTQMQVQSCARQLAAGSKPVSNNEWKTAVDSLVAYVTTGNWPDTDK